MTAADGRRGAGDGTRTHDILLGKQTLYQLSYTREFVRSDYIAPGAAGLDL